MPDWIFFGGFGATPLAGELGLVDAKTLRLNRCVYDLKIGSRAEVSSLATAGGGQLAALDLSGRITFWRRNLQTGLWEASLIRDSDSKRYDAATTAKLASFRRFGSAIAGSDRFIVFAQPVAANPQSAAPGWELVRRSIADGSETTLRTPSPQNGGVPAMGMSADGNRIVSADLTDAGRVFLWNLARGETATAVPMNAPVRTISVSRSGRLLLVGTARNAQGESLTFLWRWDENGQFSTLASWKQSNHVFASSISPDEKWLAYSLGNSVVVKSLEQLARETPPLASTGIQLNQVRFAAAADDGYRIAIQHVATSKQQVFDPQNPSLVDAEGNAPQQWREPNPQSQHWALKPTVDSQTGATMFHVVVDGQPQCQIPLDSNTDGIITSSCWIPDPAKPNQPAAIAVGTNKRNHVYLFRIVADGGAPLIRQYRGHESQVTSVSVSFDRRYLVSSSDDSTIRFWKLDDAASAGNPATIDRWGASFAVENGKLLAKDVIADGPLYYRGVRAGDVIDAIRWRPPNQTEEQTANDPTKMLKTLDESDWRQMIRFDYSRGGAGQPYFYLYPAWQPIASLVVTADREWAYWSPYGYYDASFNGHKHFGWQINRGVDTAPEFFRAAEMKEELEKPELMHRLLSLGSLEGAFLALRQSVPPNLQDRLAAENRLRPHIKIDSPTRGQTVSGGETIVAATIELPSGVQPVLPKAFANGVPAEPAKLEQTISAGQSVQYHYSWHLPLPSDPRIRVQVIAGSQYGSADAAAVDIEHSVAAENPRRRLFLIAAGVNQYSDSQIPRLEFAVNNVNAFLQAMEGKPANASDGANADQGVRRLFGPCATEELGPLFASKTSRPDDRARLYQSDSTMLLESSANRALWTVATKDAVERLRATARPDDLLVIFLSGHGISDPVSDQYYFVTSNAKYVDLVGRQYGDCIALEDFARFGEIGCRKLVVLDTCQSGAFQRTGQQDVKALVRALESDLFFTITSTEGSTDAYESKKDQLSFFTAGLVSGMQGAADETRNGGNGDGRVDLNELARFVSNQVPAEIASIGQRQYPSAAPKDLLDIADIPITSK